jgi:hypothetical protein
MKKNISGDLSFHLRFSSRTKSHLQSRRWVANNEDGAPIRIKKYGARFCKMFIMWWFTSLTKSQQFQKGMKPITTLSIPKGELKYACS